MLYDPVVYHITVTVTRDEATGDLQADYSLQEAARMPVDLLFANEYATTKFTATKHWEVPEGKELPTDESHPDVYLQLFRDDEPYGKLVPLEPKNGTVDGSGRITSLSYEWDNLPLYRADGALDAEGNRIKSDYSFKEIGIPHDYIYLRTDKEHVRNIYWPEARTIHKYWDGKTPPPGAGSEVQFITIQKIYDALGEDKGYIGETTYPVTIIMDGVADEFPDQVPEDPYDLHGEYRPWVYTIVVPVSGFYNGKPVNYFYFFKEDKTTLPTNYKTGTFEYKTGVGVDVTNVYQLTSHTVEKIWVDGPETRPEIALQLLQDGKPYAGTGAVPDPDAGIIVLENGKTTHTWENLPRFKTYDQDPEKRVEYKYSVREVSISSYVTTYSGQNGSTTITNTYVPPLFNLEATKTWAKGDPSHYFPASMLLYRHLEDKPEEKELVSDAYTVSPMEEGAASYTYTWEDLPETDIHGNAYIYLVEEAHVFNNQVLVGNAVYQVSQEGFNITNTYQVPLTDISATKLWDGGPQEDHEAVTLRLFRQVDGGSLQEVDVAPQISGEAPQFDYLWTGLEGTDEAARPYTYSVQEKDAVDGVVKIGDRKYEVLVHGLAVVNTFIPKTVDLVATKHWEGGPASDHQPVVLQLYRALPGEPPQLVEQAYTVSGTAPDFRYTWTGLDETDLDFTPYTYSVLEEGGPDNEQILVNGRQYQVGIQGMDITNTYLPPLIHVTATKTWKGGPESDHKPVVLNLFRKLEGGSNEPVAASPQVSGSAPNFSYVWTDLPGTDLQGRPYVYSVAEDGVVDGMIQSGDNSYEVSTLELDDGTTAFTNTYLQPTESPSPEPEETPTPQPEDTLTPDPHPTTAPVYQATHVNLNGQKQLMNRALKAGEFSFTLKDHANNLLETVSHDAKGAFQFKPVAIRKPGLHLFHIQEVKGSDSTPLFDDTTYTIRVQVTASGSTLSHEVSILKNGTPTAGGIQFVNRSQVPPTGDRHLQLPLLLALLASALLMLRSRLHKKRS